MKNFFLKTGLTLLCLIIGLGSAWGDTYTIDFNKGTTNGTNISSQLAANVETMCSSGYENAISITGTNCYYNSKGCGIRLAKSNGNGSLVVTFSSTIQIATVQKVIVYASAVESGNTMTVTPAGTVTKATEFSDLSTYSTSNSASTNYQLSEITINGTLTSLTFGATSKKYVMLHRIDVITDAAKTLSSIAVKTAPNKVTYTEGEMFDPAGLVITGTYSDSSTEDIAYADHAGDFTFSPTLSTALTTSNTSVTITYGSKTTTQSITVNEVPKHTANFYSNGSLYTSEQYTEGAAITFPTGLAAINGKNFVGWVAAEISGTTDTAPDFVESATMGTDDVTYYAVYATQTGSESSEPTLVNSTSGLIAGNTYYIAASKTYASTATAMGASTGGNNFPATSFQYAVPLTLGGNATDGWTFSYIDGGTTYYLDPTNTTGNNYLKRNASVTNYGKFSISFSSDAAVITSMGKDSRNILRYNSSNTCFACYSSGQGNVYLFAEGGGTSYSGYCTTIGSETPTITAESTLSLPASESDGTFNVTWTNVEEYDATLYADAACTSKIEDCDWLIIELTSSKNIDYYASANMSTSPRTVYMQLYGVAADGTTDATKVVTITQAGKQASDPTISNFIKTSSIELTIGADPYDVRQCLNIPNDYDTSTYAITTTIGGLTQKDNEYACVYPYLSFQKAGTYTVHVIAAAMPGKYAQTEGDITVNVTTPTPTITTIPDLFTKATEVGGTETDINITFNNWVVSGATTSNAYVTDGTNGFIIYQSGHGFTAGNVLNGTVACKVLLYNGAAEIKGLTSSSAGLTVTTDGTITPRTTTIDALENVNVGSVITLEGVSYDAPNLTDGENTIQPFTSLYNYPNTTFTQGTRYNVTGVYILYKSDNNLIKEILPRSAEDIQEIEAEKYDIIITPSSNGTVTASLEEAAAGVEVTLTVTPNSGYQLSTLAVTNASTSEEITVTSNKFIMPAANVNVTATFEESTPSDIIFYESFDTNKGTGGNDGAWSGSIASSDLHFDNTGWDCTSGNGANKCAKFGAGSKKGSATTPALNYAGNATLTFKAGAWDSSSEKTTLNISIDGGGIANPTSVTLTKGNWTEYTITLTGLTTSSKIKFEANVKDNNRFFLDEVTVTKSSTPPATQYDVTIASGIEHGTIAANVDKAEEGDNITITATPETGYHLATLYYSVEGDDAQNTIENLAFTMPANNVTIHATFAEDVKYTVTIVDPENGTLVVKHGDDVVKTGDKFAEGETLNITATPAEGYKFRNWQAVDGTTHTFTSGTTWTMSASDVTIKANFDPADQKYLISWNVNGTVTNQQVNANSALVAPDMTGKTLGTREFVGWTEDALVKNDTIPTYVTLGNATKDVTYYAVFADREEVTAAVPTSITAYADGNYYLVDKYVVEGVSHYYALDGNINQNNFIIPTDITAAVTENPDGSITIDESNPIIKDAMKYSMSLTVEGNDSTIVLRNLLTNKVINKVTSTSNANNLTNNEDAASWTHFYAMPHRDADDKKSLPEQIADPNRFTLSTSTSDNWESHAIFMQYSSWNSTGQVQDVSPRVKAYAVGNRGIQPPKAQMYSAGYLYFVPATPIAFSNFATHEVSVSQYGSTTLCLPQDYVMPEGLTGKIAVTKKDLANPGYYSLTLQTKYTAGDVIPAGECLIVTGEQGSYYIAPSDTKATLNDYPANLLHADYAIDTNDTKLRFRTIYDEENAADNYYYKLTTSKAGDNFGWYWGNATGEPFIMASNERVYLVIDKETASSIRAFVLDELNEENLTTFINGLVDEEINRSGRIYNLQGQMMNKLQKGINIVNGKKVIR